VYIWHFKRKCFSSSTLLVLQKLTNFIYSQYFRNCPTCYFTMELMRACSYLTMLILFFILIKMEIYFWYFRLGLITYLKYINFFISFNSLSHYNLSSNLDVIMFLTFSLFWEVTSFSIPQWFSQELVSLSQRLSTLHNGGDVLVT
jgi:hypothetical protein